MDVQGRVAVVTGGASGLGLATVKRLTHDGMLTFIADLPSSEGERWAERLGPDCHFVPTDVTDEEQANSAIDAASNLGELSVLVNCAGIGPAIRTVSKRGVHPLHDFQQVVAVNLVGTFNMTRLAAAKMAADFDESCEERGVVVNTASVAAFDGQIGQVAYSASKGGIVGMTLPMARDLAQYRVRVNTIAPGLFLTPLLETLPEQARASLGSQVPHPQRLGRPDEYADLVAHIIANPMLNGETIRLDGAIRMAPR